MSIAPVKVWGHWGAPNPWKVCMVLEELGVPYTIKFLELSEVKEKSYVEINPNGRLPTIQDSNTGLTLWESGAIIQYLVDQYDQSSKISYKDSPQKYFAQQWLSFQISGQGPYFGQATWFARFHPEKVLSATNRYINEIFRVIGVLELGLERNNTGWLVGDRCTYADLAFVTWASVAAGLLKECERFEGFEEKYPRYVDWISRLEQRESVAKIQNLMAKGRAEHGLN